jgi:hypothetical protein
MSNIILAASASGAGTMTVQAPVTSSNRVLTLEDATGTLSPLVSATAQTASGTSVDFTGIPSWVRRITAMFNSVSTNGTSNLLVQLGTSLGIVSTGYNSSSAYILSNSSYLNTQYTSGFGIAGATATNAISGALVFTLISENTWVLSGVLNTTQNATFMNAGGISLASTLTQLRLTTVNGTDTLDAGTINIMYE